MPPSPEAGSTNPTPKLGSATLPTSFARAWHRAVVPRMAALRARLAVAVEDAAERERDARSIAVGDGVADAAPGDSSPANAEPIPDAVGTLVREGERVRLRTHVPANRAAFQRWYADDEIAKLLRHDQEPLSATQSRNYFDTLILPLSARGLCYAIHEADTDRLIGTTALTDLTRDRSSALFRIVIGEKETWGRGYGTESTRLVVEEAFARHGLAQVRLEVFRHNARALAAYRRVGFHVTGEHTEWVGRHRLELHVIEMALDRADYDPEIGSVAAEAAPETAG